VKGERVIMERTIDKKLSDLEEVINKLSEAACFFEGRLQASKTQNSLKNDIITRLQSENAKLINEMSGFKDSSGEEYKKLKGILDEYAGLKKELDCQKEELDKKRKLLEEKESYLKKLEACLKAKEADCNTGDASGQNKEDTSKSGDGFVYD